MWTTVLILYNSLSFFTYRHIPRVLGASDLTSVSPPDRPEMIVGLVVFQTSVSFVRHDICTKYTI